MKPNFALRLSNDGIELVHRSTGGWLSVGQVNFASDDVGAACARLVADAERLEPGGLRTKLILPNSELRYATVAAPGPTDEARRYQIEAEIESLTPYGVEDLVYDWAVEGDFAMVVIGARETLAEAEAFAEGYGFKPVSFVAIPENGEFPREPFLGLTAVSRIHLSGKDPLSQDAEPVRITGRAVIPAPVASQPAKPAAPAAEDKPGVRDDASRTVAKPPVMPAMPRSSAPVTPAPARSAAPAPVLPKIPAPAPAKAEGAEPLSKVGDLVRRMGTRLRREQAAEAREKPVAPPAAAAPVAPAPKPVAAPVAPAALTPVAPSPAASAPAAPKPVSVPAARPVVAAVVPETREETPAPVAFASRRAAPPATNPAAKPSTSGNPGGRIAVLPQTDTARKGLGDTLGAFAARLRTAGTDVLGRLKPAATSAPVARKASAPLEPLVPASRPPANERDKAREAEALTIFGARGQQKPAGSFARGGLIAVGGGLLVLVSVAVWAIYFSGSDEPVSVADLPTPQETPVETASIAAPDSVVPQTDTDSAATDMAAAQPATDSATTQTADAATTAPVDEALAAPVQQAAESAVAEAVAAGSAAVSEDVAAALPDADPDRATEALVQEALREPVPAEVAVQAPDIAAQASEAAEIALDAPQATSLSSPLSLPGALDLGDAPETALVPPAPPPPPGATFDFDENGIVLATPDGALTPSGVTVFARRPSSAPVARPAGIVPTPVAAVAEQAAAAPEAVAPVAEAAPAAPVAETAPVVADDTPRADPALAGARPQPRSPRVEALAPAVTPAPQAPAAAQQDAALVPAPVGDGVTEPETETAQAEAPATAEAPPPGAISLAALRPQQRPTDLVPPAEPVAETALAEDPETAPGAVASSLRPNSRPDDVTERARRALAAAAAAPSNAPEVVEDDEGETASSANAPAIPSSASVARQATETDAINLGRVNLIGVFGAPSDRRALVRLSSGRVVRVAVGDTIDGGRVSAIGENEVRYTRNGRNEVLRIGG